ncbi:methionine--tRNA ligase [Halalkalicoccus paucihalophilus]|uniref:Methionine--tRNA ligase n=1 Tax=Halalkalicoccus paucihalophilus TaxID=1008153 RepID=A0A151A9G3_9EURY|nr:class I tRNA ligase family protein [Halalkalicoccus paucihalophilus]KYH24346.1 methionine--tRNA ligase [Halalkalicoccus paucihalophilus]
MGVLPGTDELIGTIGNLCYRTLLFAARNYDGTPNETLGSEVRDRIDEACTAFQDGINAYSTREATNAGIRLARFGNQYLQRHEPWSLTDSDPKRARQIIRECVQLVKTIAVLLEPVMPRKSAQIWEQLGETSSVQTATLDTMVKPPSVEFGEPSELFEPISDEQRDVLNEQLRAQRTEE